MSFALFVLITTFIISVQSAPTELINNSTTTPAAQQQTYDASQFDEVHDQRQNGTENWRINLDKIVLVWSPPGSLLTAALLADPALLGDSDFSDSDDFFKPEEAVVIKPEGTTKPPEGSTTAVATPSAPSKAAASKRSRLRVPGFLRPYLRRHHVPA